MGSHQNNKGIRVFFLKQGAESYIVFDGWSAGIKDKEHLLTHHLLLHYLHSLKLIQRLGRSIDKVHPVTILLAVGCSIDKPQWVIKSPTLGYSRAPGLP